MSPRLNLIIIIGPTASGKSELAVRLAKKFNGEIISADSRQVYRKLDIGTGKVLGKWVKLSVATNMHLHVSCNIFLYKKIPHYCIDIVSPKKTYTVAEYKKCAEQAIKDITGRGKIPILVGGTGFWIDAVVYGLNFPQVRPNLKLRKKLEKKSAEELLKILRKLDPVRAKTIDQKNPRRLIRAIEIAKTIGAVPKLSQKDSPYRTLWIGTKTSREELAKRIHRRLIKRIRTGMIEEARRLHKDVLSWKRLYELGLEYRFLADYMRKKTTRAEFITRLEKAILNYARRQMTWWKRNREIRWIKNDRGAERLTSRFLRPT